MGTAPIRILLHPGFHKTGTTSLQITAKRAWQVLTPRLRMILPEDMFTARCAARQYSRGPCLNRAQAFRIAFEQLIAELAPDDPRPVLISSEALGGQIPGRYDVADYSALPGLLDLMLTAFETMPEPPHVTVWFTTRSIEPWKRSVYWQNLKMTRLTQSFDGYRPCLDRVSGLDRIVGDLFHRFSDRATIKSTRIESCATDPLGPFGAALDLLGVSRDGIVPTMRQNVRPAGGIERVLQLNRSIPEDKALALAKRNMLMQFRSLAPPIPQAHPETTGPNGPAG